MANELYELLVRLNPGNSAQEARRLFGDIERELQRVAGKQVEVGKVSASSLQNLRNQIQNAIREGARGSDAFGGLDKKLRDSILGTTAQSGKLLAEQATLFARNIDLALAKAAQRAAQSQSGRGYLTTRDLDPNAATSRNLFGVQAFDPSKVSGGALGQVRLEADRKLASSLAAYERAAQGVEKALQAEVNSVRKADEARGKEILAIERNTAAANREAARRLGQQARLAQTTGGRLDLSGVTPEDLVAARERQQTLAQFQQRQALPFQNPDTSTLVGRLQRQINDATLRQIRAQDALTVEQQKAKPSLQRLEAEWDRLRSATAQLTQAEHRLAVAQAPQVSTPAVTGFGAQFREGFRGNSDLPYAQQFGQAAKFSLLYGAAYNALFAFTQTMQATLQEGIEFQTAVSELKLATGRSADSANELANQLAQIAANAGFAGSEGALAGARAIGLYGATQSDTATQNTIARLSTEIGSQLAFNSGLALADVQTRLAAITNAFQLGYAGQGQVADIDAYLSRRFGVAPGATINTVAEVGSVGQSAGFDLNQVSAIAALIMGRTGQTDSAVAGQLAQIFSRGGEGSLAAVSGRYGISGDQTLAEQMRRLAEIYQSASPTEQNEIAAAFGRGRVQNTISILLGSFDEVAQAARETANGMAEGASEQSFNERINNIGGQLQILVADLKEFANQLGQSGVLAILGLVVVGFRELVEAATNMLQAWNQIPGGVRSVVASLALLALALRTQAGQGALSGALGGVGLFRSAGGAYAGGNIAAGRLAVANSAGQTAALFSKAGAGIALAGLASAAPWVAAAGGLYAIGEISGAARSFGDTVKAADDALGASTADLQSPDQWRASGDALREQALGLRTSGWAQGLMNLLTGGGLDQEYAENRQSLFAEAARREDVAAYAQSRVPSPDDAIFTAFDSTSLSETMDVLSTSGLTAKERLDALIDSINGAGAAAERAQAGFDPKAFAGENAAGIAGEFQAGAGAYFDGLSAGDFANTFTGTDIQKLLEEQLKSRGVKSVKDLNPDALAGIAEGLAEQAVPDDILGLDMASDDLADLRGEIAGRVEDFLRQQTRGLRQILQGHSQLTGEQATAVINLIAQETDEILNMRAETDLRGRAGVLRRQVRRIRRVIARSDTTTPQMLNQLAVAERALVTAEIERLERLRAVAQQNAGSRAEARRIGEGFLRREVRRAMRAGEAGADALASIIVRSGEMARDIARAMLQNAIRVARAAVQAAQSIYEAAHYHSQLQELRGLLGTLNDTPHDGSEGLGGIGGTDVPGYEPPAAPEAPSGPSPEELRADREARIQKMLAIRSSLRLLAIDLTDPLAEARVAVADALDRVKHALTREERLAARVDLRRAQAELEATKFQQRLESVQTAEELGRISHLKYISYLENERDRLESIKNRTYQQQQQLDEVERLLQTAADSMQGQWNFGDIRLPTPYEVRRRVEQIYGDPEWHSSPYNGGGPPPMVPRGDVTINIDGADVGKVMQILRQYLAGNYTTRSTTPRKK